jgi:hypothetical protein
MNKRNRPRQALPLRNKPIWLDPDYRELTRDAEKHVADYMQGRGWAAPNQIDLTTAEDRLSLLENLPGLLKTVPDALWCPAVYKTLLYALLTVQHPHLELLPPDGPVHELIVRSGKPRDVPKRLRSHVRKTPELTAVAPALRAASKFLAKPLLQRDEYMDLELLMATRQTTTGRKLGHIKDDVASVLGYRSSEAFAKNGLTKRAHSLSKMLLAARKRRS